MAEEVTEVLTHPKKNSKIVVNVEEVLADILVVSFSVDSKIFKGVLLDSTKKLLPCGIIAPPHIPPPLGTAQPTGDLEDRLFSAGQRYSYFQEKPVQVQPVDVENGRLQLKRNIRPPARFKNARMTVRLRPRQVLCSKCRGICNENSENVDLSSKKRKNTDTNSEPPPPKLTRGERRLRSSGEISPRPIFPDNLRENPKKSCEFSETRKSNLRPSLIPKLSRLQPKEISNAMNGKVKIKIVGNYWLKNEPSTEDSVSSDCVQLGQESTVNKVNSETCSTDPLAIEQDPLSLQVTDQCETKSVDLPEEKFTPVPQCSPEDVTDVVVSDKSSEVSKTTCDEKPVANVEVEPIEDQDPLCSEDPLALADDGDFDGDESNSSTAKRILRKKRSVGSMEDLWDETVFEDTSGNPLDKKSGNTASKSRTTPVIKISFGSGTGEGTVVKIPAKVQSYIPGDNESEEKRKEKTKRDASAKAAKKALKKAKKEARRKVLGNNSPVRSLGGASPRYQNMSPRYQNMSPRYAIGCASPRYNFGSGSPRYNIGNSSPAYEIFHTRRHKHKMKHKKKHKEDKKHKDIENELVDVVDDSIREQCLKQKLSISLKRLNANAYMRCDSSSSGSKSPSNSETSDDHSDAVPDFPGTPLMMRISTQTINTCQTSDGRSMTVGDVVWGKIHGFPWWPGKVLSITVSRKDDGACMSPQAHVAWYGSSTSSLMSCDQLNPFLETFQMRYNKKKRGPYKEAIKQATTEAKRGEDVTLSAVYSSPGEVDVVS